MFSTTLEYNRIRFFYNQKYDYVIVSSGYVIVERSLSVLFSTMEMDGSTHALLVQNGAMNYSFKMESKLGLQERDLKGNFRGKVE